MVVYLLDSFKITIVIKYIDRNEIWIFEYFKLFQISGGLGKLRQYE